MRMKKNMINNRCDFEDICNTESVNWDRLRNKTILVTGGTGLIGTTLVNGLAYTNRKKNLGIKIICIVRNERKAKERLDKDAYIYTGSIDKRITINETIDYIIHGANPTSSVFFVQNPVETIQIAVNSTINLLDLAREKKVKGFIFLSSMEVYGYPQKGHIVKENEVAGFDTTIIRNSYPQSKQICEMLCKAYQSEYDVPAMVLRLTQTFGPGVEYDDKRVFAEFMRCVIEKKDIVLHTTGETERCYLYTSDAVTAILTVLTRGEAGQAYTVANSRTYCSILEMANMVARDVANDKIQVKIEIDKNDYGYMSEVHMMLDTKKIEELGWHAKIGLEDMYRKMIEVYKGEK